MGKNRKFRREKDREEIMLRRKARKAAGGKNVDMDGAFHVNVPFEERRQVCKQLDDMNENEFREIFEQFKHCEIDLKLTLYEIGMMYNTVEKIMEVNKGISAELSESFNRLKDKLNSRLSQFYADELYNNK